MAQGNPQFLKFFPRCYRLQFPHNIQPLLASRMSVHRREVRPWRLQVPQIQLLDLTDLLPKRLDPFANAVHAEHNVCRGPSLD
jgi:hypothetical protein